LIAGVSGSSELAEPTRGGLDDPFDPTFHMIDHGSTIYPGQDERFYIDIYSTYNGSEYQGALSPGNETTVKDVKMQFVDAFYEDGSIADNDPLVWDVNTFYNNDGDGYEIARYNYGNFFTDASNNYLEYSIKTTDVMPGNYILKFRITYQYMADWNGATTYDWMSASFDIEYNINVRSYMAANGWPDYTLYAYNENMNTDTLYSGAQHKLFGIMNINSASGTLTDIQGIMSFPGNPITVDASVIPSETIPYYYAWRINIPSDLAPGTYEVMIHFRYMRNGEEIVEAPALYEFMVQYTPLLMPPEFNDLETPFATFNRASLPHSLDIPMTNMGNVDLKHVEVRLDMSNTRYVDNSQIWFDENNNGYEVMEEQEIELELVGVGETEVATFNMINFLPKLPPGLYKIPLDYLAKYDDMGETGKTPGERLSGYWNEMGYYQHRNILRDIVYPEDNNEGHVPYILIRIVDDNGPLFTGNIDYRYDQDPGATNVYMRLRVENHEMYEFRSIVYKIHIDGGSPFAYPYSSGMDKVNATTLPPIYRSGIGESDRSGTASDSFYFYVNIRNDALPGMNYFQVDVSGFDEFNQPFETMFMGYITINAQQPRFQHTNITVGDILDDRSVEVTVAIQNMGLGGAKNLSCFFVSNYGGYISTDPVQEIGYVGPGDEFIYTFHYKPDGERRYFSSNYNGYIYFAYYDDIDEYDEMFSGSSLYIRFDIYDKLPDIMIINVNAPLVDRNDDFQVEVTVMNVGGSTASDISLLLPYSASYFDIENAEQDMDDLAPGETVV
ncbi:MAG: hypothetical protein U9R75_08980, partial [Candidatus Thermoplasmatota archaeon]|nr:hypothetical protein [Candidatus Thermoplasmatota archaeon]